MFPTQGPGYGLLTLRLSLAASLLLLRAPMDDLLSPTWTHIVLTLVCLLLTLGFLASVTAAMALVAAAIVWVSPGNLDPWSPLPSILAAVAIFLLGPGGYSLDARIYGRHVIDLPVKPD